jgi:hypothetical protein
MDNALHWADELAKEFADTKGVNDVLDFVKTKGPQLVAYTGNALNDNLNRLHTSSVDIVKALNDVAKLGNDVKTGAQATRNLIQEQDRLATGAVSTLSSEQMDLWERTLNSLVSVLDTTGNDCQGIRIDLEKIQADLITTKAQIEGMVANAN